MQISREIRMTAGQPNPLLQTFRRAASNKRPGSFKRFTYSYNPGLPLPLPEGGGGMVGAGWRPTHHTRVTYSPAPAHRPGPPLAIELRFPLEMILMDEGNRR